MGIILFVSMTTIFVKSFFHYKMTRPGHTKPGSVKTRVQGYSLLRSAFYLKLADSSEHDQAMELGVPETWAGPPHWRSQRARRLHHQGRRRARDRACWGWLWQPDQVSLMIGCQCHNRLQRVWFEELSAIQGHGVSTDGEGQTASVWRDLRAAASYHRCFEHLRSRDPGEVSSSVAGAPWEVLTSLTMHGHNGHCSANAEGDNQMMMVMISIWADDEDYQMIIDTQMGDNKAVERGCQAEGRASAGPGDWQAEEQVCFPLSDSALAFLGCLGQISDICNF